MCSVAVIEFFHEYAEVEEFFNWTVLKVDSRLMLLSTELLDRIP
ncbi:hypothetical protein [Vulcanisaeta moutnovskia]|nr:hypothetical protein [Vulcanisaeta moutnovskia]